MILLSRLPGAAFPLCNLVASSNLEQLILLSAHILFISAHICYPYNRFDRLLSLLTVCIMTIMLFAVVNQFRSRPSAVSDRVNLQVRAFNSSFPIRSSELFWTCVFNVWHHCHFIANNWKTSCASQKWWYSPQDSMHQDSPSMKALVGSRQPSTNLGAKGERFLLLQDHSFEGFKRPPTILWYPNCQEKQAHWKGWENLQFYIFSVGEDFAMSCFMVVWIVLNSQNGDL